MYRCNRRSISGEIVFSRFFVDKDHVDVIRNVGVRHGAHATEACLRHAVTDWDSSRRRSAGLLPWRHYATLFPGEWVPSTLFTSGKSRHTHRCRASPQFPIQSCTVTTSTRSRPNTGRLPSFSLFDNQLSPMNNRLCELLIANERLANRPQQTSVAKFFVSTDHPYPYPPARSVRCSTSVHDARSTVHDPRVV
jgi:hypothetical protein